VINRSDEEDRRARRHDDDADPTMPSNDSTLPTKI
jgi:hypothetical protein